MTTLVTLAFILALAAFVLALFNRRMLRRAISIIDNPQSRTVTIDHTDGRITVVKEPYADDQRPAT